MGFSIHAYSPDHVCIINNKTTDPNRTVIIDGLSLNKSDLTCSALFYIPVPGFHIQLQTKVQNFEQAKFNKGN